MGRKGERNGVLITCPCGKEFYRWAKKAARSRCCSNECKYNYARRPSGLSYDIKVENKGWIKPGGKDPRTIMNVGKIGNGFKGDAAGYSTIHKWVKRHFGSVVRCETCGTEDDVQWANKSWQYKRERGDWMQLCRTCHYRYDHAGGGWGVATQRWPKEFQR